LPYPKRKIRYAHLGKNLELVIDKAMAETDQEKKAGFAHAIAHYMKLAYSNWHKELVQDDAIRSELNAITGGELEFSNTPYIKHRNQNFSEDYRPAGGRWQNNRNNNNRGGRGPGGPGGPGGSGGNSGGGRNNNNRNFKKRY